MDQQSTTRISLLCFFQQGVLKLVSLTVTMETVLICSHSPTK